jgi:hypothetical protein
MCKLNRSSWKTTDAPICGNVSMEAFTLYPMIDTGRQQFHTVIAHDHLLIRHGLCSSRCRVSDVHSLYYEVRKRPLLYPFVLIRVCFIRVCYPLLTASRIRTGRFLCAAAIVFYSILK